MRFGYNEYMAHHYAYMTHVADYVEAAKDANWRAAMEEEMHSLVEMKLGTWLMPRKV